MTSSKPRSHAFILRYLVLLAAPLLIISFGLFYLFVINQQNAQLRTLSLLNSTLALQWDNTLRLSRQELTLFGDEIRASKGVFDTEQHAHYLKRWPQLAKIGPVRSLFFASVDGQFRVYPPDPIATPFTASERQWYRDALALPGKQVWGEPYEDLVTHDTTVTLSQAVLNDDGSLLGVIGVDLDLPAWSMRIGKVLERASGAVHQIIDLSHPGIVISAKEIENGTSFSPGWLSRLGPSQEGEFIDQASGDLVAFHILSNNSDWAVVSYYPLRQSYLYQQLLPTTLIWLGMSLAIFILVATIFRQRLEHTITALVQVVRLLRVTPPGEQIVIPHIPGIEELGEEITMISDQMQAETEKAQRDGLTGLYNRRYLDELMIRLHQDNTPYVLAIIDIDNFKQINDTHGHPAGDAVLRRTATLGEELLAGMATLCRFGGEEMVAIFEQSEFAKAEQAMERWRLALSRLEWREPGLSVTFSGGIAEAQGAAPAQLLERADEALYRAKQAGKNRILRG
ncbi:diguanylate cyclase [Aeromonas schubertii]|uniref:sensor domain-containing diguanylate cyclase n=1 Tax=Aeromonas schubertii TaxID=652 RepID=UPI00067E6EFA|nr:sensor domain-containing diguanylate cyclase [Aeromonas schubertii]KUE78814.1 diguanylate cyclase [Aeromonas schubertii]